MGQGQEELVATAPAGRLGAPRWDTRPLSADRLELRVSGCLAPDWAAVLTTRVARLGLSIESGRAVRDETGYWTSVFDVVVPESARREAVLPAEAEPRSYDAPEPSGTLDRYSLGYSDAHGGCCRLEVVEAEDCVGFLSSLLTLLDSQGLVPLELRLDTRGGKIFDSLWFRASQSAMPGPEVCRLIEQHMDGMK